MDYIDHDPSRRPFVAGTYNGHPVAVAAAIETVRYLADNRETLYPRMEAMGAARSRDRTASRGVEPVWRARDRPFPSI